MLVIFYFYYKAIIFSIKNLYEKNKLKTINLKLYL